MIEGMKRMDDYKRPFEPSSDEPKQTVDSTEQPSQTTERLDMKDK